MFIRKYRYPLLCALPLGAFAATRYTHTRQRQAEEAKPYGRYTAQQILDRAAPLCDAVVAQASTLHMTAERYFNRKPGRGPSHLWLVDCTDSSHRDIAHFDWDADTGSLFMATASLQNTKLSNSSRPLSEREALRGAWRWLDTLGVTRQVTSLHLAQAPKRTITAWKTTWKGDGWNVHVTIGLYSGLFTWVMCERESPGCSLASHALLQNGSARCEVGSPARCRPVRRRVSNADPARSAGA
jgi:hypothetical protein